MVALVGCDEYVESRYPVRKTPVDEHGVVCYQWSGKVSCVKVQE
jgi:hypothetical protein